MKKIDNKEHPEVNNTKNICEVSPKTKHTNDVCNKINKSKEIQDSANPGNKYPIENQKPKKMEKKGINTKPKTIKK